MNRINAHCRRSASCKKMVEINFDSASNGLKASKLIQSIIPLKRDDYDPGEHDSVMEQDYLRSLDHQSFKSQVRIDLKDSLTVSQRLLNRQILMSKARSSMHLIEPKSNLNMKKRIRTQS